MFENTKSNRRKVGSNMFGSELPNASDLGSIESIVDDYVSAHKNSASDSGLKEYIRSEYPKATYTDMQLASEMLRKKYLHNSSWADTDEEIAELKKELEDELKLAKNAKTPSERAEHEQAAEKITERMEGLERQNDAGDTREQLAKQYHEQFSSGNISPALSQKIGSLALRIGESKSKVLADLKKDAQELGNALSEDQEYEIAELKERYGFSEYRITGYGSNTKLIYTDPNTLKEKTVELNFPRKK
jgi:hypothetical protein